MDMEEDDAMEIEDNLPAAPIIERKSDEFPFTINNLSTEKEAPKDSLIFNESKNEPDKTIETEDTTKTNAESTIEQKDPDVVVLDDDDDEPMKGKFSYFV